MTPTTDKLPEMQRPEHLANMRRCAPLLPPPGDRELVKCLDEIDRLRAALATRAAAEDGEAGTPYCPGYSCGIDGRTGSCGVYGCSYPKCQVPEQPTTPSEPTASGAVEELEAIRGVLMDGYSVYKALNDAGKKLTTAQVSDVLDAIVKLHRAAVAAGAGEKGNG